MGRFAVHYGAVAAVITGCAVSPLVLGAVILISMLIFYPPLTPSMIKLFFWVLIGPFIAERVAPVALPVDYLERDRYEPSREGRRSDNSHYDLDAELQAAYAMGLAASQDKGLKKRATTSVKLSELAYDAF